MNARRTCSDLGVCQARAPACHGCSVNTDELPASGFVFAPGVIEGPSRRRWLSPRRVERLARVLLVLALLGMLAACLGFATGYLSADVEHYLGGAR